MLSTSVCRAVALAATMFFSTNAGSANVIVDFEDLGAELDLVESLTVTDVVTGYATTLEFSLFEGVTGSTTGTPILVKEGIEPGTITAGFQPNDTPAGEVLGNGNDWMLGNGRKVGDNFRITFSRPVADIALELIDFRGDGPFSAGSPGSDMATLQTFDAVGSQFPLEPVGVYVLPDPRPVDGNIIDLLSTVGGVSRLEVVFDPPGVDVGVVLDNISFTVLPEPDQSGLWIALGLIVMRYKCHTILTTTSQPTISRPV